MFVHTLATDRFWTPMDPSLQTDAEALWQDTLDLLEQQDIAQATLSMLKSCTPTRMGEGTLTIETNLRFVQKAVSKITDQIGECLTQAAFEPMTLVVELVQAAPAHHVTTTSSMTRSEVDSWVESHDSAPKREPVAASWGNPDEAVQVAPRTNPLVEEITQNDSRLTFENFVTGEENTLAFTSALTVAEGINKTYNPLFIYGKSGLGKTHLLRAIQNYIAKNDPARVCVYKDSSAFVNDFTNSLRDKTGSYTEVLAANYKDVDVLIIDDFQGFIAKVASTDFFFGIFNDLISRGKQIVLAADRSPAQLGMGKDGLDERVTSRVGSGFNITIAVPNYELKVRLIEAFYDRMKEEGLTNHVPSLTGTLTPDNIKTMANMAGSNIRIIESFVQACIFAATRLEHDGGHLTTDEIAKIAKEKWPSGRKTVTIAQIQREVERYYDISHEDLVGAKRNKEIMEPRHIAIFLARELTETSLEGIGEHFGGRSHATIIASLRKVEKVKKEDKIFQDRLNQVRNNITGNA